DCQASASLVTSPPASSCRWRHKPPGLSTLGGKPELRSMEDLDFCQPARVPLIEINGDTSNDEQPRNLGRLYAIGSNGRANYTTYRTGALPANQEGKVLMEIRVIRRLGGT